MILIYLIDVRVPSLNENESSFVGPTCHIDIEG